jgi:hypothetical protein
MMRSLAGVVLTALAVTAFEAVVLGQKPDLAGTYRCEGMSPNGHPYRTVVDISKDDQTYVVTWYSREGPAIGIGIVRDDTLSVSYFTGKDVGIVVYRIQKGPTLTGQWSILGADGQLYPEVLTKFGQNAEHRDEAEPVVATVSAQVRPPAK